MAFQVFHGHTKIFRLDNLGVRPVLVNVVLPSARFLAYVMQTSMFLLGPGPAAGTRLRQDTDRQPRTAPHLLGPVFDLPQAVLLALDREHLLLERLRVHLLVVVHGDPLEVVGHVDLFEGRDAEAVRVELLVVLGVRVLLPAGVYFLGVHEGRVEAGGVARGYAHVSFSLQVVVCCEFHEFFSEIFFVFILFIKVKDIRFV